jgi:hypothetical protein
MVDREKVIKGLEHCTSAKMSGDCKRCPYYGQCVIDPCALERDALELLKEQEHGETFTVIDNKTGKEADTYDIALHEEWAKHLCYCDMEGWAMEDDGTLLLVDECGRFAYADRERFKVKWDG